MSQVLSGSVITTNGSSVIVGTGVSWLGLPLTGAAFHLRVLVNGQLQAEDAVYTIAADAYEEDGLQKIALTAPYAGPDGSTRAYCVTYGSSFSPILGMYEPSAKDMDWPVLMKQRTIRALDKSGQNTNAFVSFRSSPLDIYDSYIAPVTVGPVIKGDIFAGTNDAIYKSTDGGANWTRVFTFDTSYVTYNNKYYYCVTSHTSSSSNAPGTTGGLAYWTEVPFAWNCTAWLSSAVTYTGRTCSHVQIPLIDSSGYIYASPMGTGITVNNIGPTAGEPLMPAGSCGLWRSTDGGETWTRVQALPINVAMTWMVETSLGDLLGSCYTLQWFNPHTHIYKSTDGGATWSIAYTVPNTTVSSGGVTYISMQEGNTGHSVADTDWWLPVDIPTTTVGVTPYNGETMYNRGRRHMHDIAIAPNGTLYASVGENVAMSPPNIRVPDDQPLMVKSVDGGGTWTNFIVAGVAGMPDGGKIFESMIAENSYILTVLEDTYKTTILKILSDGTLSSVYSTGVNKANTFAIRVSKNPITGTMYFPIRGGGEILVTTDGGASFDRITDTSTNGNYNSISNFVDGTALISYQHPGAGNYSLYDVSDYGILLTESSTRKTPNVSGKASTVTDAMVTFNDNTIGNASLSRHGYLSKLSGNKNQLLQGDGTFAGNLHYDPVNDYYGFGVDPIGKVDIFRTGPTRLFVRDEHDSPNTGGSLTLGHNNAFGAMANANDQLGVIAIGSRDVSANLIRTGVELGALAAENYVANTNAGSDFYIKTAPVGGPGSAKTQRIIVKNSGEVGIGNFTATGLNRNPAEKLEVDGYVKAAGYKLADGSSVSGNLPATQKTANFNAVSNNAYYCEGAGITATFPNETIQGKLIQIVAYGNAITLSGAYFIADGAPPVTTYTVPANESRTFMSAGTVAGDASRWNAVAENKAGGSMVYPGAGVPTSTGSAWGPSYTVGRAASNLLGLDSNGRLALGEQTSAAYAIDLLSSADSVFASRINVKNSSTGTSAQSQLTIAADTAFLSVNAHGTNKSGTRYGINIAGFAELLGGGTNGLLIGNNSGPTIFGNNGAQRAKIPSTGGFEVGPVTLIVGSAGITLEGGFYTVYNTNETLLRGELVYFGAVSDSVSKNPSNGTHCVGVVYESVTYVDTAIKIKILWGGRAATKFVSGTTTQGYVAVTSSTAGKAAAVASTITTQKIGIIINGTNFETDLYWVQLALSW